MWLAMHVTGDEGFDTLLSAVVTCAVIIIPIGAILRLLR